MILAILLPALLLASIVAPHALAGDTLVTRVCPTEADIAAGVSPPCVTERLFLERAAVCAAALVDLGAGRIDALVAAFPTVAAQYAEYSGMPADAWCITGAVRFTVPAIP